MSTALLPRPPSSGAHDLRYAVVPWSEFAALPPKRGGGPPVPASQDAIRAALNLLPGTALRIVDHRCAVSEHSWGCCIAIAVRNAGIHRGIRFKVRHVPNEMWVGRPPE